ncbi:DUF58 domain-containing protein [Rhodopirellula sp. MGV]|uniref:DUF58 domain-containing protein n=1 Tax=Rhodopirellula sp. MGV TaxID=2023130 RepID=UPI000B97C331|nr:DUF58 domain-containing protein [Rhodopirellula sp. MGV]OYP34366.1 DUF58 domain-containing protein [Rhodopirellula sp. MGV]PNY37456.1 DUF58 domain-containing protein [Rhodopirellula baltica]
MTSDPAASGNTSPGRPSAGVDPDTLMRIKSLKLRAKTVVEGFFSGLHRSPTHGSSIEFSEYRAYVPGDDLRSLDWKLYARSDRYFVKKFEDETNRRCYLIVDQSRSMSFGSLEYSKIDYARTVAATLAYFLTTQHDAVGVLTFDVEIGDFVPAKIGAKHFHQILVELSRPAEGRGTDIDAPLRQVASLVPRRGLVILISDLLAHPDTLQTQLASLRARGHEVVLLRVLDPSELDLQLQSPSMVQDIETGKQIYVDPESAKKRYQEQFEQHRQQVQTICSNTGVGYYEMSTDQPLDRALSSLIDARNRLGGGGNRAMNGGRRR